MKMTLKEDPIFRWKSYALLGTILLLVLSLIGGIIYGIVKFFQWIF